MPKKEICVNTGVIIPIEKVFNFSSPNQVNDKLVKITEDSLKRFKNTYQEPTRILFKTKIIKDELVVGVYFMRLETDEEFEERLRIKSQTKINEKIKIKGIIYKPKKKKIPKKGKPNV
jgi:hypothetical protein